MVKLHLTKSSIRTLSPHSSRPAPFLWLAKSAQRPTLATWQYVFPVVPHPFPPLTSIQAGIPLGYIFAETPEERAELAETFKPLAQKHKGKISFATIDAKSFGAHAGNLNLEVDKWPAFAIQETVKNQKFPFDQNKKLTHDDVGAFVQDFVDGKVDPSIKSEPIPEKQEGPVQVVVAYNYKDVVVNNENDVLLEFYAPWCGHCKA